MALDGAAALVMGCASYLDGLRTISSHRFSCGLKGTDPNIRGIAAVDSQQDSIREMFHFHREQKSGAWTQAQELPEFETVARKEVEGHCRSLLTRFRSDAFARL